MRRVQSEMCKDCPWRAGGRILHLDGASYSEWQTRQYFSDVNLVHLCHDDIFRRCRGSYLKRKALFQAGVQRFLKPVVGFKKPFSGFTERESK